MLTLRPPELHSCHPPAPDTSIPSGALGDPVCVGFCPFYRWGDPGPGVKQLARGPHLARPRSGRPTGLFPAPHWGPPTWPHTSPGGPLWGETQGGSRAYVGREPRPVSSWPRHVVMLRAAVPSRGG